MSTGKQGKLKLALTGSVVCAGALLLFLGLRAPSRGQGAATRDSGQDTIQVELNRSGTPHGRSANALPTADSSVQSHAKTRPARETEVDAPAATGLVLSGVEELAKRELSKSANRALVGLEIQEIERTQDRVMSGWPEYARVREQLLEELSRQYSLPDLPAEELVKNAVALREQFWREGGNLSASAWKSGYEARLLAELAVQKAPENLTVVDELIETLQSIGLRSRFDPTSKYTVINQELWHTIRGLREEQFTQRKAEIAAGRKATFQDFVCGADLLYLVQAVPPKNQQSIEVLQALQAMCRENGWSKFLATLQRVEPAILKRGYGYELSIYEPRQATYPAEYTYNRRFPSFRGPQERNVRLLEQLP
jgi:hypothetical protein